MVMTQPVQPEVSIIVPARNEEANIGSCLESLVAQQDVEFEIIVVNDHSTDRTREIAQSFPMVRVIDAGPLPPCSTGKNNAVITGAHESRGEWLLFTDADTVHLPGSLARALHEARQNGAALLSYSPAQVVTSFWEKAIMPVIFAELASHYRPSEISDPKFPAAAANGQYILITREAYEAVGGHASIAASLLEDVALAGAVKRSGRKILFRFGGDAVRTRMYRSFPQLREGWTKNLAILFPAPARLAIWRFLEFLALVCSLVLLTFFIASGEFLFALPFLLGPIVTLRRIARAHFSWSANALVLFGLPLFSYLLLRSKLSHQRGMVSWKGREYASEPSQPIPDHSARVARKLS
jgi:cellulose synthase/poly-beta-1,6-N-acetylglucosamine synthase-like glycosyltransferase